MNKYTYGPKEVDTLLAKYMGYSVDYFKPRREPMGLGLLCFCWFLAGTVCGALICASVLIAEMR